MKPGDLMINFRPCYLRQKPELGGTVDRYEANTLFTLVQASNKHRHFVQVLTPDGKIGFLYRDDVEPLLV